LRKLRKNCIIIALLRQIENGDLSNDADYLLAGMMYRIWSSAYNPMTKPHHQHETLANAK